MKNQRRGFVELLVLVVVALVIIFLLGLQPSDVWTQWVQPLFLKLWDVIVAIARAIAAVIKSSAEGSHLQPSA